MCGICGVVYEDEAARADEAVLRRMSLALRHRGPDDEGVFVSKSRPAGLAHRRLAVIDPAGGAQPMANEDGSLRLVCNGEIYNYRELRAKLIDAGHIFATKSDNEVILHLYEEHGPACVNELRGMFAFGLWYDHNARLLLGRDRLGQKPLCWYHQNGAFIFASGIASILKHPGIARTVSPAAIHQFLTYQYIPHPLTIYEEINKLPPAHTLVWEGGRTTVTRYWKPRLQVDETRSADDWCDELRERLTQSVGMRLMSDVPLGAFLSGGLDSSIVVGLMSKLAHEPVKTFSIGFADRRWDERPYARLAARKFGTAHHEFLVHPDALKMLPELVRHYGEPYGDSSAVPTFYLSRVTRDQVTVALTGDGGDELFAGYPRYLATKAASALDKLGPLRRLLGSPLWRLVPASVEQKTLLRRAKKFALAAGSPLQRYYQWIAIFDDEEKRALYEPEFAERTGPGSLKVLEELYAAAGTEDPVAAVAYADLLSYLPGDLLTKIDVASMSVGLEARSPFLDHPFVEFALTIPARLKLRRATGKWLLKRAFADLLPNEILIRDKMGFGVPISSWFRGPLADYLRQVLLAPRSLERGRFRPDALREIVEKHIAGKADNGYKLWNLLNLELWERAAEEG